MDGKYSKVIIKVNAPVMLGQTVGIGGNSGALGCFDKDKFIQLYTTPKTYPIWTTLKPIILPRHKVYQYKYCVVENGKCKDFESSEVRHFITEEIETVVQDEFHPANESNSSATEINEMLLGHHHSSSAVHAHASTANSTPTKSNLLHGHINHDNSHHNVSAPSSANNNTDGVESFPVTEELVDGKLVIVCYHLPVIITRNNNNAEPFSVTWAESLIAKSKDSVSSLYKTVKLRPIFLVFVFVEMTRTNF